MSNSMQVCELQVHKVHAVHVAVLYTQSAFHTKPNVHYRFIRTAGMASDIDDMMEHLDTWEPEPVAVYVGEPYSTGWVYVPRDVAEKIEAVVYENEVSD